MMKSSFEIAGPQDDHDEYWDDEDESEEEESESNDVEGANYSANGGLASTRSNVNGHRPANNGSRQQRRKQQQRQTKKRKKAKMKKMKVATQRDYSEINLHQLLYLSPKARGCCCIFILACILVISAAYVAVPKGGSSSSTTGASNNINNNTDDAPELPTCEVHTTQEPFSEWTHHIRKANASTLCRPDVARADCQCHNPFQITIDDETEGWHDVFDKNLKNLNQTLEEGHDFDLILYGDSIVERMNGMVFGQPIEDGKEQLDVTKELLTTEGGGSINALPLGIAGDEIHTLMYRLSNGEMPESLTPGAWWLMIGTDDVIKADCDVDAVVAGIVTTAEYIFRRDQVNRHDDVAHVVINSLFPPLTLGSDPLWTTIQTINSRLECYAETTKGIEFFNATGLFVAQLTDESFSEVTSTIYENVFLEDGIHLSAVGIRLWEEAIVEKTLELMAQHSG